MPVLINKLLNFHFVENETGPDMCLSRDEIGLDHVFERARTCRHHFVCEFIALVKSQFFLQLVPLYEKSTAIEISTVIERLRQLLEILFITELVARQA